MQGLVTVFGGTGFVGRYVVRALAREGWRIRVAARRPDKAPELRVMGGVGQIEFTPCNVRDADAVARAVAGSQAVVNLVGVLFEQGGQGFDALHAQAAGLIARAATQAGAMRLVQVSAIGADAASPALYARTKAAGEAAVREGFPSAVILRPSIVFGPEDAFFNRFAAMACASPALPLIGGGLTRFQPVYAGDVGEAVVKALALDLEGAGRIFELGGPEVLTFKALLELMLHKIGKKRLLAPIPFPVATLMGEAADLLRFLPIPPPITRDQVELLKADNVVAPGAATLADLGVEATALEAILPTYLWRFRSGGQFAADMPHPAQSLQK